jgi:hypothetical protein|tara:strand:- start:3221 stop:3649 length:429 start_codon:yes stop_codon:yes gene_type:complete
MIYISGIPHNRIDEVWEECKEYVEMGNDKSLQEMNIDDIYEKLKDAHMQLWIVFNQEKEIHSVITTEIATYPRKTTCRIVTCGGSQLDDWVEELFDILEEWAKEHGCVAMETCCRKGFIKKLDKYGYKHTYTILGKDLQTLH